ncbi:hypothetical protein [Ralstonia phage RP31]|uniref:Uncharacterized protein n=2 Tax=Ripduovirus RP12 TaxID=2560700 RepID=A0A1L7N1I8_9CAUD|nr:hypothetical protein FDH28_gp261 [Ralstonia phage RP12]BAW19134.1 hypothetical protein [Ralstonia phage RP12]BAW19420.1 hypothetical protein [Ralstonia phage RP31]
MNQLSNEIRQLGLGLTDHVTMKYYFDTVKPYPKHLVTQNHKVMQQAYVMVPADIWSERIIDLQDALQLTNANDWRRRQIVTSHSAGMSAMVDEVLDAAFLAKYDELLARVTNDFRNLFPYKIARTNQKLMVFEKLDNMQLVEYVLKRL